MLEIYGSPKSSAGRCFWTLEEVGIEYKRMPFSFKTGDHKKPEFLSLNPNGKVPVVKEGDFVLWESMAINNYLVEKYKPELGGKTLEQRAQIQQWSFWALAELQTPTIQWFIQEVFVPEERRDLTVIENARKKTEPLLQVLDRHLEGRSFMVADHFTVADINVASVVDIHKSLKNDLSHYNSINKWLNPITERPAYLKYQAME